MTPLNTLLIQQTILIHRTFSLPSLLKMKMPEFAGDPLDWPEFSRLSIVVFHNVHTDDNEKLSHFPTLVRGKAKVAKARLVYYGALHHTAWDPMLRNFGQHQTVVNAQMILIHTYLFTNSYDSGAIIIESQFNTTCAGAS